MNCSSNAPLSIVLRNGGYTFASSIQKGHAKNKRTRFGSLVGWGEARYAVVATDGPSAISSDVLAGQIIKKEKDRRDECSQQMRGPPDSI